MSLFSGLCVFKSISGFPSPGSSVGFYSATMNTPAPTSIRGARRVVGPAFALFTLSTITALGAAGQSGTAPEPGDVRVVGAVDFPVTCAPAARPEFVRGVALLHSFFYEEARRIFTAVAEQDPACAMAQWGIAMSWWHPIWTPPTPEEMRAGKAAADKAMALTAGTDRERRFITALSTYYNTTESLDVGPVGQSCHGPVGARDRVVAYEKAMRELYAKYPDDFETQTFYALAVLSVGYATPTDTTLANQLKAAAILEKLWKQNPRHPGVTHYLIHCYDYPALAERGLPAAQAYGSLAPWVPHALHMPSHIYTRLGMWDEAVAANRNSSVAARAYAAKRQRTATEAEELHGLDYMVYSYLQEAQDADAKDVRDFVATVRKTNPELEFSAAYALAAIPSRYALERNAWAEAATLPVPALPHWAKFPFMEALIEYAHAIGRARSGDFAGARQAIDRMRQLADATTEAKFDYYRMHLELQLMAANAWVTFGEGKKDVAIDLLRRVAKAEDDLGKSPVSPGALVPVREQLGDMLLETGRPQDALAAFEAALKIYPGRYRGLYGAALAAERAGDQKTARHYYAKLAAQTAKGDGGRSEVGHIREYLATDIPATKPTSVADTRH
jgi:tetratricopeptide (TPR) repeat protein